MGQHEVLDLILAETCTLLGVETAAILLLDETTQTLEYVRGRGLAVHLGKVRLEPGEGVAGRAVAARAPVSSADVLADPAISLSAGLRGRLARHRIRGALAVPLTSGAGVLGALAVAHKAVRRFRDDEVRLLSALASAAALAVANARLFEAEQASRAQAEAFAEETQRHLDELRNLGRIAREITTQLDPDRLLEMAAEAVRQVLGCDISTVAICAEPNGPATISVHAGAEMEAFRDLVIQPGSGLGGKVLVTRVPAWTEDCLSDPGLVREYAARAAAEGVRGSLCVPLLWQGQVTGLLWAMYRRPHRFTPAQINTLERLADVGAIALQNARLFTECREARDAARLQRDRAVALAEIGRLIVSSLDLDRILDAIVERARELLGARSTVLRTLEPDARGLRLVRSVGLSLDYIARHRVEFVETMGLVGRAVAEGRPVWSRDIHEDNTLSMTPALRESVEREGIRGALAVPIFTAGGLFGVLAVQMAVPHDFPPEDVSVLASLAQFAGIAVDHARLYTEARAHAEILEARVRQRTAALEATNAQLVEASRAKSAFLAGMSHELRTPLHAILGFTEILLGQRFGALTPAQTEFLTEAQDSGHHLVTLINDVLDLAKVEAGKVDLRPEPFDLGQVIAGACASLQTLATDKQLQVTVDTEETLPPLVADLARFKQILYNLLSNAIKFTPQGGRVTVSARKKRADDEFRMMGDERSEAGEVIEIQVVDTGIGINPEDQARIFEAFEQGKVPGLAKPEGTGLGLALTRELVELHGGRIWVESAGEGQGSTFTFTLPWRPPRPARRILIVEDEPNLRRGLRDHLTAEGYAVDEASGGHEALAAAASRRPDLVLLDIGLPDLDGRQVLAALRQRPATQPVPVVVLTGLSGLRAEDLLAEGANEFLTKPFSLSLVSQVVRGFVAER